MLAQLLLLPHHSSLQQIWSVLHWAGLQPGEVLSSLGQTPPAVVEGGLEVGHGRCSRSCDSRGDLQISRQGTRGHRMQPKSASSRMSLGCSGCAGPTPQPGLPVTLPSTSDSALFEVCCCNMPPALRRQQGACFLHNNWCCPAVCCCQSGVAQPAQARAALAIMRFLWMCGLYDNA